MRTLMLLAGLAFILLGCQTNRSNSSRTPTDGFETVPSYQPVLHRIASQPADSPPDSLFGKHAIDGTISAGVIIDSTGKPTLDKVTRIVVKYAESSGSVEEKSFGSAFQPIPDSLITRVAPWTREYVSRIEATRQNEDALVKTSYYVIRIPTLEHQE